MRDELTEFRELAYSSVMTIVGIMEGKGYVRRKKQGANYLYSGYGNDSSEIGPPRRGLGKIDHVPSIHGVRPRTGEATTSRHLCVKMFRLVNLI